MQKLGRVVLAGALALGGAQAGVVTAQRATREPRAVAGELIVKFREGAAAGDRTRARGRIAGALVATLAGAGRLRHPAAPELIRVAPGLSLQAALERLSVDAAVEYAEPNWIYTHAAPPNDPSFPSQWALENTGQAVSGYRGRADADIDAVTGWQTIARAQNVYVGVIDEGIDFNHPDLGVQPGGVIWTNPYDPVDGRDNDGNGYVDDVHGWDFANGDNSVYDGSAAQPDVDAHGTHVAGTIGARTGNGVGIAGVSPGVVLIPAKFLGVQGGTTAHAVMALDYLTDLKVRHGLNIVATNNSWSGGGYSRALLDAIARAARQDILFIAASGNGGADGIGDNMDTAPVYPGSYDTTGSAGYDAVITVTATDSQDALASWANFGYRGVDLGAPGSVILSTTPRNTYSYSSGTSMATPHVTGAAVLAHAARGLSGYSLREVLLGSVDAVSSLAGRTATGGRLNLATAVGPRSGGDGQYPEVILLASQAPTLRNWSVVSDTSAAGGARLQSADLGAPKLATAAASPTRYFEMTFQADAGVPYRLWIRGRAEGNSWANDSVHVQFDRSVDGGGNAAYRIGTTSSAAVNLEDCNGCGLSGWGWQDNGYGAGVLGPVIYFGATGSQRIRVQVREDGLGIDQIVLSSARYLASAPGALRNDRTLLAGGTGAASAIQEIVLHAADATRIAGAWSRAQDATAASGIRLQSADAGAPKVTTARSQPADFFELSFEAEAGRPYRLWIRARAAGNSWANDSVHVQFSGTVGASNEPLYRIGTSSAAVVNLEDCSGCGLAGWGWQDNGYGAGALGPEVRFERSGPQTLRVQIREDGLGIDQIVLSSGTYRTSAPGSLRNDATILPRR